MALSPEEKAKNKQRLALRIIHNGIKADFSFKKITTWNQLHLKLGLPSVANDGPITFAELKLFLDNQTKELEERLNETISIPERLPIYQQSEKTESQKQIVQLSTTIAQPISSPASKTVQSSPAVQVKIVSRPTGTDDWNDCTVLALSSSLGISYEKARETLIEEGRKNGKGLRVDYLSEFLLAIGFQLVNKEPNLSLQQTIDACKNGRFIVRNDKHAFAIVDGVIYDWQEPDPLIKIHRIYRFDVLPKHEEPKLDLTIKNDYGFTYSSNESFFAYWFQKKAIAELSQKIFVEKKRGVLLLSATGTGKTFIALGIARRALDRHWHDDKTLSHIPYLYITKSTILEQTGRVAEKCFNLRPNVDLEIVNIEQLRSKDGRYWVKEKVEIVGGEEVIYWEWKNRIQPCIILLDESQGTKNKKAKQSQIIHAYNELPDNTCLISISATPFVRVCEAQSFAVSTHRPIDHLGFPKGTILTNETWPAYASIIALPGKPDEYNQAAIERLMKDLEDYIIRVRGVKPQFDAVNGVKIVQFESKEKRIWYNNAYERFLKEKEKDGVCYLVVLLKFAMAAELCHADHFAKDMYTAVTERGKAAVAAVKFKQTLIQIVKILNEKYGVSRDQISLIWGGGQTQQTKKQKTKEKVKSLADKFKSMGVELDEILEDIGLDEVEDRVMVKLPEHLRLGAQDQNERQQEIDRFQSGKSLYCIYTLRSGGVGLSLHHTDELSSIKCRRKESGYAVEEDIPNVSIRPRETFVVVTYNAIELVQGVGRVPRLTSLSPTIQNVYCYADTVEVDMARIYSQKLRCLSSVVKQREDWQDVIFGGSKRAQLVEEILKRTENIEADESSLIDEGDEEESNGKE